MGGATIIPRSPRTTRNEKNFQDRPIFFFKSYMTFKYLLLIIVCIQGKASHWFPSGTMSGATKRSPADTVSTWQLPTPIPWKKTPKDRFVDWPDVFAVGVKFHALSSRFNLIFKEYPQARRKGNLWQFFEQAEKNPNLKGQCHEIFCFWFFSWISFPPAPEYYIKTVSNFFENSRRYSQLKVCHRCQRHRWQMEKVFNQNNFINFVWSPLGSRGNVYINFCLQVHFQVSASRYCSHYLPPVSMTPAANLPPVSLIPAQICHRCQQYKGNWWQNLLPVSLIPVANLPPVSLIPVVHLYLRISPRIFENILNDSNVIIRGLGEGDSWKKPEAKNLVTLSL